MAAQLKLKLQHPATIMVSGPTSSGKTTIVKRLVTNSLQMFEPPPRKTYWFYSVKQPWFETFANVTFIEGLPDINILDPNIPQLLVLDDLMNETNATIEKFFTTYSHHYNVTVIFITQNLYFKSARQKSISLNTQYLFLFKNIRDANQIKVLERQIFPNKKNYLLSAYEQATNTAWGYLMIDLRTNTLDNMRLRSNIFPGELSIFWVPQISS